MRRRFEQPGSGLARSYLGVRAEQAAEAQSRPAEDARGTARLPRLDRAQLTSPEAHAQYRLALLAKLASSGQAWFVLAERAR